jgi:AcrR family transcriptional regulator
MNLNLQKPRKRGRKLPERRSRNDWLYLALQLLSEGDATLNISKMAQRLDVARGSFYWHFQNRAELLESALKLWQQRATEQYINALTKNIVGPQRRLVRLIEHGFAQVDEGLMFASLHTFIQEPLVRQALQNITYQRAEFCKQTLFQAGFSLAEAEQRAELINELYLGLWSNLRLRADGGLGGPNKSHLKLICSLILPEPSV